MLYNSNLCSAIKIISKIKWIQSKTMEVNIKVISFCTLFYMICEIKLYKFEFFSLHLLFYWVKNGSDSEYFLVSPFIYGINVKKLESRVKKRGQDHWDQWKNSLVARWNARSAMLDSRERRFDGKFWQWKIRTVSVKKLGTKHDSKVQVHQNKVNPGWLQVTVRWIQVKVSRPGPYGIRNADRFDFWGISIQQNW